MKTMKVQFMVEENAYYNSDMPYKIVESYYPDEYPCRGYDIYEVETDDIRNIHIVNHTNMTESINRATDEGYERITRAEAYNKISLEKWRREYDQAMSGYAPTAIIPYKIEGLPEDERPLFQRIDKDYGEIVTYFTKNIPLYSDDGIVFYQIIKN